jgi:hypothetical protein
MSAITNTILTARVLFMTASNAVRRKLKVMPIQLVLRDMAERGIKVRELVALAWIPTEVEPTNNSWPRSMKNAGFSAIFSTNRLWRAQS